jgi:ABC-2 type transport system ATP-binding protein
VAQYERAQVDVYPTLDALAEAAAAAAAGAIREAVALRGQARLVVATGNSQKRFIKALASRADLPWQQVEVFHMDEYVGLAEDHPASFRRWIRTVLVEKARPRSADYINGEADSPEAEVGRYAKLLAEAPIDVAFVGFGENGHIAFNEPGAADFEGAALVKLVELEEASRRQQVGEGHFSSVGEVPRRAITITCSGLFSAARWICVVPERRKAAAVKQALEGPITPRCPASLVRRHPAATVFLDQESASLLSAPAPAIRVTNLVKRYPKSKVNAVDGVSFEVSRGEIFGLLGPNGAGKTTTIGILTTAILPTEGSAYIMGVNVAANPIDVKQHIAVVPQQSNLDRSLKVREILTFHAAYHGVPKHEREALADKLLDELGLGDRKNEKVTRYSGGMVQRLMIARALMHGPAVLFLDEPTNNLDPQSRLFLWERIRELNAQGLTILLTTHDMEEADKLCQRIAVMDHGKILVNDTPAELKKLIPGGTVLEVRAWAPAPDQAARMQTNILAALSVLPGTSKVDAVVEEQAAPEALAFRVYAETANTLIGPAAQAVLASGAEVRDLSVKQPSLEEVFIFLTGRHLR